MPTITVGKAQAELTELIDMLAPGEEVVITRDAQPVAQLNRLRAETAYPEPGRCQGMLTILVDDDEHLQDWTEYLPRGSCQRASEEWPDGGLQTFFPPPTPAIQ